MSMARARIRTRGRLLVAAACMIASASALANPQLLERARGLIAAGNASQAFAGVGCRFFSIGSARIQGRSCAP